MCPCMCPSLKLSVQKKLCNQKISLNKIVRYALKMHYSWYETTLIQYKVLNLRFLRTICVIQQKIISNSRIIPHITCMIGLNHSVHWKLWLPPKTTTNPFMDIKEIHTVKCSGSLWFILALFLTIIFTFLSR